jgi:hypothetical protein
VSPGRCYICRAKGRRWRDCSYLGRGCYYCGGQGHIRRDCPRRTEFIQGQDHRPKASNSLSLWIDWVDQHSRGLVEIEVGLGCRVTGPRAEYFI